MSSQLKSTWDSHISNNLHFESDLTTDDLSYNIPSNDGCVGYRNAVSSQARGRRYIRWIANSAIHTECHLLARAGPRKESSTIADTSSFCRVKYT